MGADLLSIEPQEIDSHAVLLPIFVPASQIVEFQAYFELHEGIGIIRTLEPRTGYIVILTTRALWPTCLELLDDLRSRVEWRLASSAKHLADIDYLA